MNNQILYQLLHHIQAMMLKIEFFLVGMQELKKLMQQYNFMQALQILPQLMAQHFLLLQIGNFEDKDIQSIILIMA